MAARLEARGNHKRGDRQHQGKHKAHVRARGEGAGSLLPAARVIDALANREEIRCECGADCGKDLLHRIEQRGAVSGELGRQRGERMRLARRHG